MAEFTKLKAADGHELSAYVAAPEAEAVGAVVVIQEIFGVNAHIRSIADRLAKQGYLAVAPALFDRVERGVELRYEGEDMKKAVDLMNQLTPDTALLDVAAAFGRAEEAGKGVAVIGFCYGGMMTWLSATRGETVKMRPDCCVGYYPGGIGKFAAEEPSCPVMLHFGAEDTHIGKDQVEAVRKAHPEVQIFVYEGAEHGFNCDARGSYNPERAKVAWRRTLEFLKQNLA